MKQGWFRTVKSAVALIVFVECSGCGYIMHPERRGQTGGQVDATVAIMDGVGVLLFVVPGVIAFIVDFSTGAIYLPHTNRAGSRRIEDMVRVSLDTRHGARAAIEQVLREQLGVEIRLNRDDLIVTRIPSVEAGLAPVAMAEQGVVATTVASATDR